MSIDSTGFNPDEWMSTDEAAAAVNLSASTLRRRMEKDEIPHTVRPGGAYRVPRTWVDAEVAAQRADLGTASAPSPPSLALNVDELARRLVGIEDWSELPPLLDLPRAAKLLGVDVRRLRQSADEGTIPAVRFGARYKVPSVAVIDLLCRTAAA
jgi:excisionase family DNA binding protein